MKALVGVLAAVLVTGALLLAHELEGEVARAGVLAPSALAGTPSAPAAVATAPIPTRGRAEATPHAVPPASGATLASVACGVATPEGERLDGVAVLLRRGARPYERGVLRDGAARFTGLAPGRYSLEVEAASLPTGFVPVPSTASHADREPFELARGERREILLAVVRGATVQGFVRGPDGEPLEGALVRLQSTRDPLTGSWPAARTGSRGEYALLDVLPGAYRARVDWPAELCAATPPAPLVHVLAPDAVHHVDFRGERTGRMLRGRLEDPEGRPAAGVSVVCELAPEAEADPTPGARAAEWSRVLARTESDEDGSFSLGRLPGTRVQLRVAPRIGAVTGLRTRGNPFEESLVGPFDLDGVSAAIDAGTIAVRPLARISAAPELLSDPRASRGS